jgi:selenide, water dikinase
VEVMATLNSGAAEVMRLVNTHAATDVTGFGLVGHLSEMLKQAVGVRLFPEKLPYFEETVDLSRSGFVPGGLHRNRDFYEKWLIGATSDFFTDLLFDPQTSGGLLLAVDAADQAKFEEKARRLGISYWVIGEFIDDPIGKIVL